jgi:hypothetical protein
MYVFSNTNLRTVRDIRWLASGSIDNMGVSTNDRIASRRRASQANALSTECRAM